MPTVISVESLTKQYDLGVIGTGTLTRDLNRWWARVRKQPDPYARIGQKDQFEEIGGSILALAKGRGSLPLISVFIDENSGREFRLPRRFARIMHFALKKLIGKTDRNDRRKSVAFQ